MRQLSKRGATTDKRHDLALGTLFPLLFVGLGLYMSYNARDAADYWQGGFFIAFSVAGFVSGRLRRSKATLDQALWISRAMAAAGLVAVVGAMIQRGWLRF